MLRAFSLSLVVIAFSGCWPVVPGPWDAYDEPEETLILAYYGHTRPVGGYWASDAGPFGLAFWGVFGEPQVVTGLEAVGPVGGCTLDPGLGALQNAFDRGGAGTSRWQYADRELRVPWGSDYGLFVAETTASDFRADTSYSLAPLEFGQYGTFSIPDFLRTPSEDFVVTHPPLQGAEPAVVPLQGYSFAWSGAPADWIGIYLTVVDVGFQSLRTIGCVVEDTGAFTIPPDLLTGLPQAESVVVEIGPIAYRSGRAPIGEGAGYRSAVWLAVLGATSVP